jgi:ferredoxin
MCEFCTKHGEGQTWYLNAKNYSLDLLSDARRKQFVREFFRRIDTFYKKYFGIVGMLPFRAPVIGPGLRAMVKRSIIDQHWGQVIPIEDVEKVLAFTNSIVRIPCVCRKSSTGKEARMCFLISVDPKAIGMADMVDRSFFGGPDTARFEAMRKDEALDFMREQEKRGVFHSIWTHGTPFIGGICNCDDTGCIPMKMYKRTAPVFFKSEYIIENDEALCRGCKACAKVCPFGALGHDTITGKTVVDRKKCWGCGICRSVCKGKSLRLAGDRVASIAGHI